MNKLKGMMMGLVCYRTDPQTELLNLPPEAGEAVSTLWMVELI